jgi:hypothetical protein
MVNRLGRYSHTAIKMPLNGFHIRLNKSSAQLLVKGKILKISGRAI